MPNRYTAPAICIFSWLPLFAIILFSGCSKTSSPHVIQGSIKANKKTTAPLSISYRIPARIAVNKPRSVTITCLVQESADDLVLTLKAGAGLEMASAGGETRYGSRPAKAVLSKTVILTAKKEGILYLNVFMSGMFNGRRMALAGAVPVTTGEYDAKEALKKAAPLTTDRQGQPIITMPAQEGADK